MVFVAIDQDACRGCRLCRDECPVQVIKFDDAQEKALVATPEDCIACLSCAYICPSGAIRLADYHVVKNFYRDTSFSRRAEKFL